MKGDGGPAACRSLQVALHVQGNATTDRLMGTDPIHSFLHLAVATVSAFDGVGRSRQERIIQERQGLFQVGREEFLECLTQVLESSHASSQTGQLGQSRFRTAAAVKETIGLIHDLPQDTQSRQAAGDSPESLLVGGRQMVLDEQMTMVEQVGDLAFDPFLGGNQFSMSPRGPSPADLRQGGLQVPTSLGYGMQDGLGQFCQDVELADLVRDRAEDLGNGGWVQWRTVGGDASQAQAASLQCLLEPLKELGDVFGRRVVIKDLVEQPLEPMVVYDRQDAIRPIVQFVRRDVAGEVGQNRIQVFMGDVFFGPFFPPPPPSSEGWRTGQRRGGHARGANWRSDRANRLRPPGGRRCA